MDRKTFPFRVGAIIMVVSMVVGSCQSSPATPTAAPIPTKTKAPTASSTNTPLPTFTLAPTNTVTPTDTLPLSGGGEKGEHAFRLRLLNSISYDLCEVYITSSSSYSRSRDLLPISLGPGETYQFQITGQGNPYNIEVVTCDGQRFYDGGINFGSDDTYEFYREPDERDSE